MSFFVSLHAKQTQLIIVFCLFVVRLSYTRPVSCHFPRSLAIIWFFRPYLSSISVLSPVMASTLLFVKHYSFSCREISCSSTCYITHWHLIHRIATSENNINIASLALYVEYVFVNLCLSKHPSQSRIHCTRYTLCIRWYIELLSYFEKRQDPAHRLYYIPLININLFWDHARTKLYMRGLCITYIH